MNKILLVSFFFPFLFISCEEQMIMIPPAPESAGRVLLLEDYTGVNCVPCFGANAYVEELLASNPGSVIAYGIHGSLQSEPISGSTYDFRYPDAADFEQASGLLGKPSASFNRVTLPNGRKVQLNVASWQGFVDTELTRRQVAEIKMERTYDDGARQADIDVIVIPREDIAGDVNVHVVVTESHLVDSQASPDGVEEEFEHNHVMKASLTGLLGAPLASNLKEGNEYTYNVSYTCPEEVNGEWNPENMEVIAFITAKDRDDEVLQAFQIHMTD